MSNFLTIEQWNEFCKLSSGSFFDIKSSYWKKLDEGVRAYINNQEDQHQEDQQRAALKDALVNFTKQKGGVKTIDGKSTIETKRNCFGIILAINVYVNEKKPTDTPPSATPVATDAILSCINKAVIQYKPGKDKEWKESIKKEWKKIYKDLKEQASDIKDSILRKREGFAASLDPTIKAGFESFGNAFRDAASSAESSVSGAASSFSGAVSNVARMLTQFGGGKESRGNQQEVPQEQKNADSKTKQDSSKLIEGVQGLIKEQINQILIEFKSVYQSELSTATFASTIFIEFWSQMKDEITDDLEKMIPYYGLAKEGAAAFKDIKKTCSNIKSKVSYDIAVKFLGTTNPDVTACLESVNILLKQLTSETAARAGASSAKFGLGVAAVVGTGGLDVTSTTVGGVTAGIKFLYLLGGFVGTYFAMEEANRLLKDGKLESLRKAMGIFPLLGAFVIKQLYPTDLDFANYTRAKNVFALFGIVEQLKPPFDGPLVNLYQLKTKSIKQSADKILDNSHFKIDNTLALNLVTDSDWEEDLKIKMEQDNLFNMALTIQENNDLYKKIDVALKDYKTQIGTGPGIANYRILGGIGNRNILGASFQSKESKRAVALLSDVLKTKHGSADAIAKDLEELMIGGLDRYREAYFTEAQQYVRDDIGYKRELFQTCLNATYMIPRLVQCLLGMKTHPDLILTEIPNSLKQPSRLYNLIYSAYKGWCIKNTRNRLGISKKGFQVPKREEPT